LKLLRPTLSSVQWSTFVGIAEVMASTPTQSIFNNLVNYGMADYGVVVVVVVVVVAVVDV
jgi:hypothetical protein